MLKKLYLIFLLLPLCTNAQTGTQLFDILSGTRSSDARGLTVFNNKLYFYANDGINGQELWSVTETGIPAMVANISPDTGYNTHTGFDLRPMAVTGNVLQFWATDNVHYGLYAYDGKSAPLLKKDLLPLNDIVSASLMTPLNDKIYFAAIYNYGNSNVWSYEPVTNIAHKASNLSAKSNRITAIGSFNGKIYFSSNENNSCDFLVYDPATDKARLVKDIYPGLPITFANSFTVVDSILYFYGQSSTVPGAALYAYDGNSAPKCISCGNGIDIVNAGTISDERTITGYNGKLYYVAVNSKTQYQLLEYNVATKITSIIHTNQKTKQYSDIKYLCSYNGQLYFNAADSTHGQELWMYDGAKTLLVEDIYVGKNSANPADLIAMGNSLFFVADGNNGYELHKYTAPVTGIKLPDSVTTLTVYPNPTNSNISLDIELQKTQAFSITITDMQGKTIQYIPMHIYTATKHKILVQMQFALPGSYTYSLQNADGKMLATGNILKQ